VATHVSPTKIGTTKEMVKEPGNATGNYLQMFVTSGWMDHAKMEVENGILSGANNFVNIFK